LAIILTFVPDFFQSKYKIYLPVEFELFILFFIAGSLFLGEVIDIYERIWWWDVFLHFSSGFVLAFAGFLILYSLHIRKRFEASPKLFAVLTFAFGFSLGAVFEIFEFIIDELFGTNLLKSGLDDTMWDLIVDASGSLIMAFIGYEMIRSKKVDGPIGKLIERFYAKNPTIKKGK